VAIKFILIKDINQSIIHSIIPLNQAEAHKNRLDRQVSMRKINREKQL